MSKRNWIIGLIGAFSLLMLFLFTLPQGASNASYQQATITTTPMEVVVESLSANLRAEPGTNAKSLGLVKRGTHLVTLGAAYYQGAIWYLVQLEGDDVAWISDAIVHVTSNPELVPTINLTQFFAPTNTPTSTPTNTNTPTNTPTPTDTPTNTPTSTPTPTSTFTPTYTATPTSTNTPTNTATSTPTSTKTPTRTPVPPTNTPKPLPTKTVTVTKPPPPSLTPQPRATNTPKATVTKTPVTSATRLSVSPTATS